MESNLSKIKPKFRTQGNITGNFGKPKVKSGSTLMEIGMTSAKTVKITSKDQYLDRLYQALEITEDKKLKSFLYDEIKKILIQKGKWSN